MIKVVYNACYGGFGLSQTAIDLYEKLGGTTDVRGYSKDWRHDPILVQVVEELGEKANTGFSKLEIYEVTTGRYYIDEYDGYESVVTDENIDWVYCDKTIYPEQFL